MVRVRPLLIDNARGLGGLYEYVLEYYGIYCIYDSYLYLRMRPSEAILLCCCCLLAGQDQ